MAKEIRVDVKENKILEMDASLLSILLKDNSSGKNLIWATDNYAQKGFGYGKRTISTFMLSPERTAILLSRARRRQNKSNSPAFVTKPRCLLHRGFVMLKTT